MDFLDSLDVRSSIEKSLSYLSAGLANGGIISSQTFSEGGQRNPKDVLSVYIPTFMVHCLGFAKNYAGSSKLITSIVRFLISQADEKGIWRFYGKENSHPPPDFDDTCCVLSSLRENGIMVESDVWKLLPKFASKEGLYYTWIDHNMNKLEKYRIDGVVNLNILYYGALCGKSFEVITRYVNQCSANLFKNFSSWFESEYAIFYVVSRTFADGKIAALESAMQRIVQFLVANQHDDGSWGRCLDTVLSLAVLVNSGYRNESVLSKSITYLLRLQQSSGEMESQPFFRAANPIYYGSSYLTTSIFLESLAKLLDQKRLDQNK